ncbi:MAG TPA: hypothetical protein VK835_00595 [Bacteroidia bacterium]|jgi:hypothetical protein|nr:hypothetical protein [Bacteroidia bacterium]
MQKLLYITLLLIAALQAKAQYSTQYTTQSTNDDSTITTTTTNYRHHHYYYMSGKNLNQDYLLARLNKFQSSANELSRAKIHLGISMFFLSAFVASYIVPNPTSLFFSIIGVPSCLIESAIARKHFRKSIQLYNREMYQHRSA